MANAIFEALEECQEVPVVSAPPTILTVLLIFVQRVMFASGAHWSGSEGCLQHPVRKPQEALCLIYRGLMSRWSRRQLVLQLSQDCLPTGHVVEAREEAVRSQTGRLSGQREATVPVAVVLLHIERPLR